MIGFNDNQTLMRVLIDRFYILANNITETFSTRVVAMPKEKELIRWLPPFEGWLKLNIDEACKGNPDRRGIKGLIRDSSSAWMIGYCGSIKLFTSLQSKLESIKKGLFL